MEMGSQKDSFPNGSMQNGSATINEKRRVSFSANSVSSVSMPARETIHRPSLIQMYTSKRWGITFLSLSVITLSITLRMGMSMAIVCMVKPANESYMLSNNQSDPSISIRDYDEDWVVHWDSDTQGQVLSSYYYGFPIFCVLGGYAAGKYSGKMVLLIMMTSLSVASMGIPYAAITSPYIVMVLRIVVGLASGGIMPCISQIISRWAPLNERSQIMATAMAGQIVGNVVAFVFSGLLCTIPYQNGWPLIFYIFGICNLLIMIVWVKFVFDHPEEHPRMTTAEIEYIAKGRRDSANIKMPDPPWMKILKSPPFYAILSAHVAFGYIFTTMGTFLPLYMNDIMKFDTALNGVVSSVPFVGRLLGTVVSGYIADRCYTSGYLSTRAIRIIFQTIGMVFSAPFLVGLSYLDNTQRELAVCLLILYWFVQGASSSGFRANHLDIAPRFAGIINGMTITFSSLAALVSPLITTAIVQNRTREEWQIVFFICVGVGIVGTIIFDLFAQGDEQEWAQDQDIEINVSRHTTPNTSRNVSITDLDNKTTRSKVETCDISSTYINGQIEQNEQSFESRIGVDNPTYDEQYDEHFSSVSLSESVSVTRVTEENKKTIPQSYSNYTDTSEAHYTTMISKHTNTSTASVRTLSGNTLKLLAHGKTLKLYIPNSEQSITESTQL